MATFEDTSRNVTAAVLNSTGRIEAIDYSPGMSSEPFIDDGFAERWAAWQARGAANDRATRRKLFVLAAVLVLSAAILNSVWWS
jgi:hypothetical protein